MLRRWSPVRGQRQTVQSHLVICSRLAADPYNLAALYSREWRLAAHSERFQVQIQASTAVRQVISCWVVWLDS